MKSKTWKKRENMAEVGFSHSSDELLEIARSEGVSAVNFSVLAAFTDEFGFLLYDNLDFYHS